MRRFASTACVALSFAWAGVLGAAQPDFEVTGTPIPGKLLQQNYGAIPKGISGFDLNICNVTEQKQSLLSSRIYQALANSGSTLEPIGRDIMLAAILRSQNHSVANILSITLNSATGVLALVSSSRYRLSSGAMTGFSLGAVAGRELLSNLQPILSASQLEKFEGQVLEQALVLDGGSCVERTVFVTNTQPAKTKVKVQPLSFHIH